jgi:hypothetical protein
MSKEKRETGRDTKQSFSSIRVKTSAKLIKLKIILCAMYKMKIVNIKTCKFAAGYDILISS